MVFTRRLGAVDFHDPTFGQATYAKRDIQAQRTGADNFDVLHLAAVELHDSAFAVVFVELIERELQRFELLLLRRQFFFVGFISLIGVCGH